MVAAVALLALHSAANGQWTLSNGTRVSVVFLDSSKKVAWRPDGTAASFTSIPHLMAGSESIAATGDRAFIVAVNAGKIYSTMPSVRFKLPNTAVFDSGFIGISENKKIWLAGGLDLKNTPDVQDVAVGVADGPWQVDGWESFHKGVATGGRGTVFSPTIVTSPFPGAKASVSKPGGTTIAIRVRAVPKLGDYAVKVVAKDKAGHDMTPAGTYKVGLSLPSTYYYFTGDVSNLALVQLVVRPYEWTTVKAAHFKYTDTAKK
jgi:hypothetical protein